MSAQWVQPRETVLSIPCRGGDVHREERERDGRGTPGHHEPVRQEAELRQRLTGGAHVQGEQRVSYEPGCKSDRLTATDRWS